MYLSVRASGRFMGITIGAMIEEIQGLYQQQHQPCFLYLSSEVIKEFTTRPDGADDCFLLASRCIHYCPQSFISSAVFPALVDCLMIGITVQYSTGSICSSSNDLSIWDSSSGVG
ncbi:transportin MOS14-like isoform X2 [Durio zibethinus]|uniref:Transportin MOS14-like isoform X2 n=1 Tax=Durio zibethinus TaxID=66656 RepID=A0A6P5XGK8_DURZI|nr:transportin MOS14-like isoform X2 [Durio zibethinus]